MIRSLTALAVACAVVSQFYCASLNTNDGNGSGVGNGKISGVLHNPDGSRAKNAVVQAIPTDYSPYPGLNKSSASPDFWRTTTNDTGGFTLDSLPEQTFNVFGSENTNRSFIDSVRVEENSQVMLGPDTLRAPGSIRGIIRLMPEHDSRSIFILVLGTTVWTAPEDSIGNFTLADMAKGGYHVRFLSTQQGYQPLDTQVSITSGSVSVLSDTLRLKFTGVPVPSGLKTGYDTLMQVVTVKWNRMDPDLVSGYILYRRNIDSNIAPAIVYKGKSTDTLYRDSTAFQDMSYEYWVTAFNSRNQEGAKSGSAIVTIAGIFSIIDSVVKGSGSQPGQFGYITRIALDSAGNMYITDTKNSRLQKFDGSGNFIFMDSSFLMPMGLTISDQNELLVPDFDGRNVVRMDLNGVRTDTFFTTGKPLGALSVNDRQYVVSDSGIEIFSNSDSLIRLITLNVGKYNSGDITTDDVGNIIISLGDKVYRLNEQNNSLTQLYQITDKYINQNGRVTFLRSNVILFMANNSIGPIYSILFALNLEGTSIAKWSSHQNISDIYSKNNKEILAITEDGKILKLNLKKEIN